MKTINAFTQKTVLKKRYGRIMFFLALSLYLIAKYTEISTIYYEYISVSSMMRFVRLSSYMLLLIVILLNVLKERRIIIRYVLIIGIMIGVAYVAKSVTLLFNFLFIFEARNIDNRDLIKHVTFVQIMIVGLVVVGCFIGLIPNWVYEIDGRYRESLGFFYPNRLSSLYFFIVISICYLSGKKFDFVKAIVLEGINVTIYHYTNSRMAFALTTVSILAFWVIKHWNYPLKNSRLTRFIYLHSLYILPLAAVVLCIIYSPSIPVLDRVNSIISNRLLMGHNALANYPIRLLGQRIEWVGFGGLGYIYDVLPGKYNAVDCAYVKILLDNGLVVFCLSILGYFMSAYSELKKGNRFFCIAILFMSIYCLIEPPYIETGFNPFVWTLSVLITKEMVLERKHQYVFFELKNYNNKTTIR